MSEAAGFTPQEESEDTSSWVPYVLAGAGGVCILCGLAAFFVVRRRKERCTFAEVVEGHEGGGMEVPAGNATVSGIVGPWGYSKLPTGSGEMTIIKVTNVSHQDASASPVAESYADEDKTTTATTQGPAVPVKLGTPTRQREKQLKWQRESMSKVRKPAAALIGPGDLFWI